MWATSRKAKGKTSPVEPPESNVALQWLDDSLVTKFFPQILAQ
jgi:hypothetical protein